MPTNSDPAANQIANTILSALGGNPQQPKAGNAPPPLPQKPQQPKAGNAAPPLPPKPIPPKGPNVPPSGNNRLKAVAAKTKNRMAEALKHAEESAAQRKAENDARRERNAAAAKEAATAAAITKKNFFKGNKGQNKPGYTYKNKGNYGPGYYRQSRLGFAASNILAKAALPNIMARRGLVQNLSAATTNEERAKIQSKITALNTAAQEKKAAAEQAATGKKNAAQEKKNAATKAAAAKKNAENAAIKELSNALIHLQEDPVTANKRTKYANALRTFQKLGLKGRNGSNMYNSTGALRPKPTSSASASSRDNATHQAFIQRKQKEYNKGGNRAKQTILGEVLSNLNVRISRNKTRAPIYISNARRIAKKNTQFQSNLNMRQKLHEAVNKKTSTTATGSGVPGQQIIFGSQPGPSAPTYMPGPSAPTYMPGPSAPTYMPGPSGPSISIAPTIRVNVPQGAVQALPPAERSALNNAGGYTRASRAVYSAGGPEMVTRAINALERNNGNVEKAIQNTGLPRQIFKNVNKLGGPVTARRTLTAVKKIEKKSITTAANVVAGTVVKKRVVATAAKKRVTVTAAKKRVAVTAAKKRVAVTAAKKRVAATAAKKRVAKKKKVMSSRVMCPICKHTNITAAIIHQIPRKNLEKNVLACLHR